MTTSPTNSDVIIPADWIPGPTQGDWTYNEYTALPDDGQRYEIANGVLLSTPSSTGPHQETIGEVFFHLQSHIKLARLGLVIQAPFVVELSAKDVFQPDIFVVMHAHLDRIRELKLAGPPDLVVEVSTPGTIAFDRLTRYDTYEYSGVLEYWILNLERRNVEVFVLEGDEYHSLGTFHGEQKVPSQLISWLSVRVDQFFMPRK